MQFFSLDILARGRGFFSKGKSSSTLLLLLVLSFFLLILPANLKRGFSDIVSSFTFRPFESLQNRISELSGVHQINAQLRAKVTRLTLENIQLQEKGRENERLKKMLEFKAASSYQLIPAEVIASEPGRISTSILINLGQKDGVIAGMPVVDIDGLVGKVSEVYSGSSVVQLLFHPNCRVSALDSRSRVQGIVRSRGGTTLNLDNVPVEEDVKPGDEIYSSGLGEVFPQRLKIGQVISVSPGKDAVFKIIRLKPAADFSTLEELFLIKL